MLINYKKILMESNGLSINKVKPKKEFIDPEILLERMDFLQIAKGIVRAHKLKSKVVFNRRKGIKADYVPEADTITIEPTSDFRDFVMTVLHECHHAIMANRLGVDKFIKKYNQAGTMAAHGGLDPHDNNKWEKKAENYAEKNIDKWMKKLKKA
tara:strand:+ start:40 stop:501 length:462 start_codon:yes stop_codon:yes gene_type:complete